MGRDARAHALPDSHKTPGAFTPFARFCLRFPWAGWIWIWLTGAVSFVRWLARGTWDGAKRGAADGAFAVMIDIEWFKGELRKLRNVETKGGDK